MGKLVSATLTEPLLTTRQPQGRLTRARAKSRDSSSGPTPAASTSGGSEYQTPLTSHGSTPTPAETSKSAPARRIGRIEVQLPASKPSLNRHRALRNNIYSMNPKRKRNETEDSDDSDSTPDAKLARKLQEEEDAATSSAVASSLQSSRLRGLRTSTSVAPLMRATGGRLPRELVTVPTGKGRQVGSSLSPAPRLKLPSRLSGNLASEVDSDGSDVPLRARRGELSLKGNRHPLALRRKQVPASDDDDLDDLESEGSLEFGASDADAFDSEDGSEDSNEGDDNSEIEDGAAASPVPTTAQLRAATANRRAYRPQRSKKRVKKDRDRLEEYHPELKTMWTELENMPVLKAGKAEQPTSISRQLKPFQLEGLAWMKEMEKTEWKGGLLGDEMGLGKTIQAVSLIMSDFPISKPSLVLVPPVALMQWMTEIESYTDGTLKTLVLHGTNSKAKNLTIKDVKKYHVIIMSYNTLESMYRKQEKGFKRKDGIYTEKSVIHQVQFHRAILDEAHSIKTRTTMTAKACFALKVEYRWCLSGTPLQNRIGEFFSLIRFLNVRPFASYMCKHCTCTALEWNMDEDSRCKACKHGGMQHVSVFNQELLNPIQRHGNFGPGKKAFQNLRILTDRIMLRRLKKDHTNAMELPVKEINVERQFFGEEENDFANSIMTNGQRRFDTYVATGVLLNNYANIFGLIMQMRQVADHPDLILKKNSEGGQNVLVCNICDEPAEDAIRSRCRHDFCRACAKSYLHSSSEPNCPQCHIPLSIDLEQPEIEQDETLVKKSSIINRIKMENWTSSSKIELLVHELHKLRSDHASHKSIIFSQFTTMLQLIEWRLRRAGITTVMLDGSMTPAQRQASIEHFMKNADVECFLVSLKAGGVALNLTEASRVFIVDPYV